MPNINVNGLDVFYTEQGSGEETLVFGHGLLMDTSMWDAVAPAFANQYRVICFDFRGQGKTGDPGEGYDIDTLVKDISAFIQATSTKPVPTRGLFGSFESGSPPWITKLLMTRWKRTPS